MAGIDGKFIVVQIDGTIMACETDSNSLSISSNMIDATCKDSGGYDEFIMGSSNATVEVNAAYVEDPTNTDFADIVSAVNAKTLVAWTWGSAASGETYYSGNGYISELTADAPRDDRATYSFTIQVSGPVASAQNP